MTSFQPDMEKVSAAYWRPDLVMHQDSLDAAIAEYKRQLTEARMVTISLATLETLVNHYGHFRDNPHYVEARQILEDAQEDL